MKLRWLKNAASGCLIMLLSGCSFISDPVSLMTTPDLPADKATLMGAVISSINGSGTEKGDIIRPRSDSDPSSIRIEDLNNDGIMEAVVFYKTPNEEVQIHGMILQQQGNSWVKKLDFDGEGTVLESFDLIDITNDGKLDIVAGFSRGERELQNGMAVYTFTGDSLRKILPLPYTHFEVTDLNGDRVDELTVVSLQKYELSSITTYQYDSTIEDFQELTKLDLGQNIESYYNIVSGKVAEDREGIILDTSIVSNASTSKMIVMEDGELVDVLKEDAAYKELPVISQDINGDGILEIGLLQEPSGWEGARFDEIPFLSTYYQWDGETLLASSQKGLNFVTQRYEDMDDRFFLNFPPEWHNLITIDPESDKDKYLKFILQDSGKTVAEVKFFSTAEWEQAKQEWKLLVKDEEQVIGYKGDLKLTKNERKTNSNEVAPIERKGK
ncbi:VCBS repeat-containing protein [Paenibacillus lemnae]|uniref:FG-GAP repeat domain-containing protein n=1 Tax=Paenibacillus lemnae TaxID=1330551 RepID=UPI0031B5A45A